MQTLNPETHAKLQRIAIAADRDLGVNATTNGRHGRNSLHYTGQGVDIGFINGHDVGRGSVTFPGMKAEAEHLQHVVAGMSAELRVTENLGPVGQFTGTAGPLPIQQQGVQDDHANHVHVGFGYGFGPTSRSFSLFEFPGR